MTQKNKLALRLELIWWVFTAVVLGGVLFPIFQKINHYPFLFQNVVFIVLFITLARWIFLLKHTFFARKEMMKLVLLFLCIPVLFYLISQINSFQTYMDEEGIESILPSLTLEEQASLGSYIRTEMVFFGVGAAVSALIFPFRMVISVWRTRNRGTV